MFRTKRLVLLPIALCDGNRAVVVINTERVVCDIPYSPKTAAAIQQRLEARLNTWPHFNSSAVASVRKGDVVYIEVFHDIGLVGVLT